MWVVCWVAEILLNLLIPWLEWGCLAYVLREMRVLFDLYFSLAYYLALLYTIGCTLASHWECGDIAVHGDISCRIWRKR
jgi:hypothetical protein